MVFVESMMDAIETSLPEGGALSEEVDMDVELEVSLVDEEEDLPEEEEDVHVGGVDDVSKQANVEDKLESVLESIGMTGGGIGIGGMGGI